MTPRHRHHAALPPLAAAALVLLFPLLLLVPASAQPPPSRDKDNGAGDDDGGGGGGYMQNQSQGFSAPMIVLLVALIVAFFFIGFFSVYMRRCGRGVSSSGGPTTIPAAALLALSRQEQREQEQQQRGLDPAVVASFPTMRYAEAKELRVGGKDAALECAVCLSEFDDDEELRFLPRCSHAFHPDCIGEWLAGHVTCPVCRCNLNPEQQQLAAAVAMNSGEVVAAREEGQQQQQDQVAIDLGRGGDEEEEMRRREEAMELERIGSQRRAVRLRSRSVRQPPAPLLVPRSHSTGHSLATRLDGDLERFTLRLPEHVRREMVAAGEESLRRTAPAAGRDHQQEEGRARLGRSDRWPSFITRTFSSRVPFWSASSRAPDAEAAAGATTEACTATARAAKREKTATDGGSVTPATKGSVRFDCLGGAAAAVSGARVGDGETEDEDEEKPIARQA
ncbi:hypothetical protein HU200_057390 [Digitaria exilis]|uniref:RING-type E3 ubiquitin transferase n=1 Tax=Digitaria exilis TaxID=1010633 RepID=A0A835AJV4_9POAL|nr:hypothetical protein HU200_057390 [Digitaria exilis]CAB3467489.1 unnamed protein product [Digitaria exilis]